MSFLNVDGIEIEEKITEQKANWLCFEFGLRASVDLSTGEEESLRNEPDSYKRTGKHRSLTLQVKRKRNIYTLTIRGSLHKFYHGNNKCSFTGFELINSIKILCDVFRIVANKTRVLNIEIGTNIPVWFPVYEYLKLNLLYHKKKAFQATKEKSKFGFYCYHDDYFLKMYAKEKNLLRYEEKYTSTVELKRKYNIEFLSDLIPENINALIVNTCEEFGNILMRDGLNITNKLKRPEGMKPNEVDLIYMLSSKHYLSDYKEDLAEADKKKKSSLRQFHYRLHKNYKKVIAKFGNKDHHKLFNLIIDSADTTVSSWEQKNDVTFSPIDKRGGEIVTYTIRDCNKIKNTMKVKSKKQQAKEKVKRQEKQVALFMLALNDTIKKIEEKKAA